MLFACQKLIGNQEIATVQPNGSKNSGAHHNGHKEHRLVISDCDESRAFLEFWLKATQVGGAGRRGGRPA